MEWLSKYLFKVSKQRAIIVFLSPLSLNMNKWVINNIIPNVFIACLENILIWKSNMENMEITCNIINVNDWSLSKRIIKHIIRSGYE